MTPQQSIEAECARRGASALIAGCIRLIDGQDADAALMMALGGPAAGKFLDGRPHTRPVLASGVGLRGLLWAWQDSAAPAVRTALADESWRVREMAAKVVGKPGHEVRDRSSPNGRRVGPGDQAARSSTNHTPTAGSPVSLR